MRVEPSQLKAFLLDGGLTSKAQLAQAEKTAETNKQTLEEALINSGLVKKEELTKLKAYILGIPFISLEEEKILPAILNIIPESIARKWNIVAFRKVGRNLEVAMLNPEDLQTIEFLKEKANLKILPRLTSEKSIQFALDQYQETPSAEKTIAAAGEEEIPKEELEKAARELPVIKIVDTLIKQAFLRRASDIQIEPMEKELAVRYRIGGALCEAMTLPNQVAAEVAARIKVLANLNIGEHHQTQEGDLQVEIDGRKTSLRVSIMPVKEGEKIILRLQP
ncbi:MAG: ATPase, T2SS/T4P/T4SS family [Candidatus Portnoybacteria bacterium]|nr:ATPase, T2SS/T4P/T4SS family [Candidatus Portnoybacteria bacterium]